MVYYVRKGALIKIGFSGQFRLRMVAIQPDEILAVEQGSLALERERHAEFEADRAEAAVGTEWFHPSPALMAHIAEVSRQWAEDHAPRPKLASTQRAAKALGVHPRTIWRNAAAGKITPHGWTPGGQMRWDIERLRAELGHR